MTSRNRPFTNLRWALAGLASAMILGMPQASLAQQQGEASGWYETDADDVDAVYYYYVEADEDDAQRDRARMRDRDRTARSLGRHVTGDLVDTATVELFGEKHVIAKIQKSDGETCLVDLGPQSKVKQLDLTKGVRLRIDGREGVLRASRIRVGDKTAIVERGWEKDKTWSPYDTQGRVADLRREFVDGDEHLIAYLEGPDGWLQRVNLGEKEHLQNEGVRVKEGDRIRVEGYRGHVTGTAMVFANQIEFMDREGTRVTAKQRMRDVQSDRPEGRRSHVGEVARVWTVVDEDTDEQVAWCALLLENGKTVHIELGDVDDLEGPQIARGDRLEVSGKRERGERGEMIVVAKSVRVEKNDRWRTVK